MGYNQTDYFVIVSVLSHRRCLYTYIRLCSSDVRFYIGYERSRAITGWTFSIANAMIVARTFMQCSVHERKRTSNKRRVSNKRRSLEATQSCQEYQPYIR